MQEMDEVVQLVREELWAGIELARDLEQPLLLLVEFLGPGHSYGI